MTTNALTTPAPTHPAGETSGSPSPAGPESKAGAGQDSKQNKAVPMTPVALSTWADLWKPPPQEKSPHAGAVETWREVVDTIVFVVVLVLILKSFVAECFVIPTGSMAETLYGYHKLVDCPSCGLRYSVNCSQEVENPEMGQRTNHGVCPNCLQTVDLELPRQRPSEAHKSIPDPGPSTGDRVLVSKFFNDLLGLPYLRWAVVVFKFPGNSHPSDNSSGWNPSYPTSGPQKEHTAMNYIKRLIGLPGEWIAIHGGDLYVMTGVEPPKPEKPVREIDLWQFPNMYENAGQEDFRKGKFQILRKPPTAVIAESRLVYNHDHPPSDLTSLPRWIAPQGGAVAVENTGFLVKGAPEKGPVWLRYQHLLRKNTDASTGEPRKQLITDIMGYNDIPSNSTGGYGNNWVADLMLEATVEPEQRPGAVIFELSRGPDRFQARLDCQTGAIDLLRLSGSQVTSLKKWENGGLKPGSKSAIRFANVDRALHLWIDNRLITGDGIVYEAPLGVGPVIANDFEPASIALEGLAANLTHLKLSRDTYYTVRESSPQNPDVDIRDWTAGPEVPTGQIPPGWDKLRALPVKTYYVQPGHYLCMGDNSSHSSDGRSWGLVPHRLMLGQAVAIYYPILRMGKIR